MISAGEGAGNLSVPISRRLTTEQAVTLLPEEAVEDVRRVNASTKGGIPYEFLALGDGEILAARKPSFRQTKGRARVGVLDLEGTFSPFPEASGHPTWPSGALAGDWTREHAVWAETASPEKNAGRWAVYSADRRKGTTRIVASGRGMAGAEHPVPPGGIRARIAGRYVYWPVRTAESVVDGVRSTVQIERRLLTGRGDVEVVARAAKLPAVWDEDLFFVRSADVSPGFRGGGYEIRRWHAGREELLVSGPLAEGSLVTALAAGADRVSWIVSGGDTGRYGVLYSLDLGSRTAVEIGLTSDASTSMLGQSGANLLWGSGTGWGDAGQYVWVPGGGVIYRVGEQEGFSVILGSSDGAWVMWGVLDTRGRMSFRGGRWHG